MWRGGYPSLLVRGQRLCSCVLERLRGQRGTDKLGDIEELSVLALRTVFHLSLCLCILSVPLCMRVTVYFSPASFLCCAVRGHRGLSLYFSLSFASLLMLFPRFHKFIFYTSVSLSTYSVFIFLPACDRISLCCVIILPLHV